MPINLSRSDPHSSITLPFNTSSLAWGPPSGILIHTIGFGFLAGADVYDVVLILRNRKAVRAFANPKVSLGAELSVAAGPLGGGAMVDTGIEAAPVLSYVKSKGLYGGAQVDGEFVDFLGLLNASSH